MATLALTQLDNGGLFSLLGVPFGNYEIAIATSANLAFPVTGATPTSWSYKPVRDQVASVQIQEAGTLLIDQLVLLDGNAIRLLERVRKLLTAKKPNDFNLLQALHLSAVANFRLNKIAACERILNWLAEYALLCHD